MCVIYDHGVMAGRCGADGPVRQAHHDWAGPTHQSRPLFAAPRNASPLRPTCMSALLAGHILRTPPSYCRALCQTQGQCPEDRLTAVLAQQGYRDEQPEYGVDEANDSLFSLYTVLSNNAAAHSGAATTGGALGAPGGTGPLPPLVASAANLQRVRGCGHGMRG